MQMTVMKEERVERLAVNASEAAKMLGISTRSLWARVAEGVIPTKRLGGRVLFPLDGLRGVMNVDSNQTVSEKSDE